jgi:hypothetical protein
MQSLWSWLKIIGQSLFYGITVGGVGLGIGLGAIIPKTIDPIAKPLVCQNGTLQITQNTTSYRPGESDTWTTDTCVSGSSSKNVSNRVMVVVVAVFSLVSFFILFVILSSVRLARYGF